MNLGQFKAAIAAFEELQTSFPEVAPLALYLIGEAYGGAGDTTQKRAFLQKALQANPKLPEQEFVRARNLDLPSMITPAQASDIRDYYFRALNLVPTDFKAYCFYMSCYSRIGMEMDSYVQCHLKVDSLKELADRAGATYVYFALRHEVDEFADTPNGYKVKSNANDGDKDYRVSYVAGEKSRYTDAGLPVGPGGSIVYKFHFPGCKQVLVNIATAERLSASADNTNWTVIMEKLEAKPRVIDAEAMRTPREYHPIDISSCLADDGTVYVKIEPGARDSFIRNVFAMGLKAPIK
jgi:tetratricopeptide (TPR) repeat protein